MTDSDTISISGSKPSKGTIGMVAISAAIIFAAGTAGSIANPAFQMFFIYFMGFALLMGGAFLVMHLMSSDDPSWNGGVLVAAIIIALIAFASLATGITEAAALIKAPVVSKTGA